MSDEEHWHQAKCVSSDADAGIFSLGHSRSMKPCINFNRMIQADVIVSLLLFVLHEHLYDLSVVMRESSSNAVYTAVASLCIKGILRSHTSTKVANAKFRRK